jgi:hypothetical protein
MIDLRLNARQLNALKSAAGRAKKSFGKELAAAINAVAKDARTQIGRDVRSEIAMKAKDVKNRIKIRNKASTVSPVATVSLEWAKREGLEAFGARQNNKGVSYKISNKESRKTVLGAFMGPSPGVLAASLNGGVFIRMGAMRKMTKGRFQGKIRQPIVKLRAVSAAGAFVKNGYDKILPGFIRQKLSAQIERRIKLNVLRANGLVSK